jgi:hypothetical protein
MPGACVASGAAQPAKTDNSNTPMTNPPEILFCMSIVLFCNKILVYGYGKPSSRVPALQPPVRMSFAAVTSVHRTRLIVTEKPGSEHASYWNIGWQESSYPKFSISRSSGQLSAKS